MMNPRSSVSEPLHLYRVAGPEIPPVSVPAGGSARIGRAIDCEICLADPTVSRNHCLIAFRAERWFITDQTSRAGTLLNAVKLAPGQTAPLESGDLITLGPWLFRVMIGSGRPVSMPTVEDTGPATILETIQEGQLAGMAQQRLALLLDYASELNRATSEEELASIVLKCAIAGSGVSRAALVKPLNAAQQVEIVASMSASGARAGNAADFSISRSLLNEAAAGRIARLTTRAVADVAVSIADLGINSALAAPIMVDSAVVACLYLDARGAESRVRADAADFCTALARLCGLAYANIKRAQIEQRRRVLESELAAAREAQQLIVPRGGVLRSISYRVAMQPGSFVAGDLFDVVPLPNDRVAVCIGDVTGHGVGAGILMAAAQSHLNAMLRHTGDPAASVAATNAYLSAHSAPNRFVSLWVGVFSPSERSLTFVDAGHGHWMLINPGRHVHAIESTGGPPLGVVAEYTYPAEVLPFEHDYAALLYSDGIIEQRSPTGEMFGRERVRQALLNDPAALEDPSTILESVIRHATTPSLDDDATAAVVRWSS